MNCGLQLGTLHVKSPISPSRSAATCPNKLDVYFDNVGGEILEAALNHLNLRARIVMCGGISGYNATQPIPGPANLMNLVTMRARMEGFIILDYMSRAPEAIKELLGWIASSELKFQVDVQEASTISRIPCNDCSPVRTWVSNF